MKIKDMMHKSTINNKKMLQASLANAIEKSSVKWKRRTKDLSEKSQGAADNNLIFFSNGLHNSRIMLVVNAL